jgi:hypothetical protein
MMGLPDNAVSESAGASPLSEHPTNQSLKPDEIDEGNGDAGDVRIKAFVDKAQPKHRGLQAAIDRKIKHLKAEAHRERGEALQELTHFFTKHIHTAQNAEDTVQRYLDHIAKISAAPSEVSDTIVQNDKDKRH